MDPQAQQLVDRIKAEIQRASDRQERDARRKHALRRATLMLGTGISADGVRDWLAAQGLVMPARISVAKELYDKYGRQA